VFKWIVSIEVDPLWIADGFNLTEERLNEMLLRELSWAYAHEVKGQIIEAPDPKAILKEQGYSDDEG
jgi:hypothetical protein